MMKVELAWRIWNCPTLQLMTSGQVDNHSGDNQEIIWLFPMLSILSGVCGARGASTSA